MLAWTKLPSVHHKGKHFFTTTIDETRYWVTQRCGLVGYWQVEDNYGAVWGSFDTAKQAMNAVEQMGSTANH